MEEKFRVSAISKILNSELIKSKYPMIKNIKVDPYKLEIFLNRRYGPIFNIKDDVLTLLSMIGITGEDYYYNIFIYNSSKEVMWRGLL